MPKVIFHRLIRKDLDGVLSYYERESGSALADRFFESFLSVVEKALNDPRHFHVAAGVLRRANLPDFPYHFLYREKPFGIRVLVLRHDRRHPDFGLRRR
ncbi:type II toxin-antitoxin system RelE/ParE family toxin [Luteolibacter soli]|uniref:Type II toxin-antitoxin system RelE/ParE family toxin n=1 Tax=Luteolibacter soli TaxID=3135280 RepID=A0ABU9B2T3_9BACT